MYEYDTPIFERFEKFAEDVTTLFANEFNLPHKSAHIGGTEVFRIIDRKSGEIAEWRLDTIENKIFGKFSPKRFITQVYGLPELS